VIARYLLLALCFLTTWAAVRYDWPVASFVAVVAMLVLAAGIQPGEPVP